jgi:murein DD-endopeptidase MepM/ murein hydrolase activator NlpD
MKKTTRFLRRLAVTAALALAVSWPSLADDVLTLYGALTQGEAVLGKVRPGDNVIVDRIQVPVTKDGYFILGISRDAGDTARLVIQSPDGTQTSRVLRIQSREWPVQHISGLKQNMVNPDPREQERITNDQRKIALIRAKTTMTHQYFLNGFTLPVDGPISGVFGSQRVLNGEPRNYHNGADLAAPAGTPVLAPAGGVVALAEKDMFLTGGTIMLDHGLGLTTVYAHLSALAVAQGQTVKQGQKIGAVGATGRASGPHLHWGASVGKVHIDPESLLRLKKE